jgi:hypothetical protein
LSSWQINKNILAMKALVICLFSIIAVSATIAQDIQTVFGKSRSTGGYVALSNKFTAIGNSYANIPEVYAGVFINQRWLVGFGVAASTNDIRVPVEYSVSPTQPMTYQYGQAGMKFEYVMASRKAAHVVFNVFGGAGFTAQYNRYGWPYDYYHPNTFDENWFYVIEPGAQLEMNLFRWMRLSPGVSYRHVNGSSAQGLSDGDLSNWSYSVTLKIGGFGRYRTKTHHHYSSESEN